MNQLVGPLFLPLHALGGEQPAAGLPQRHGGLHGPGCRPTGTGRDPGVRRPGTRPTSSPGRRRASHSPCGPARLRQRHRATRPGDLSHESASGEGRWGTIAACPPLPRPCTSRPPSTTGWPCATTPSPAATAPSCRPGPTTSTARPCCCATGWAPTPTAGRPCSTPTAASGSISWNHRGTGGSERPVDTEHVGIDAFAEDAIAVMDDAGHRRLRADGLVDGRQHHVRGGRRATPSGSPGCSRSAASRATPSPRCWRRSSCPGRSASRSPSTSPAR